MIITTANCPSCGGPINFKVGSSITVICEFCGTAVARTDRDVRNLGKVADLIDTQSPLRVGLEGRFNGKPFVLTGRVQIAHSAGGVWDEWYASFGSGSWGWLAEAQGRFYMTFYRQSPNPAAIPPQNALAPGARVPIPGDQTHYVVGETGIGRIMGAQGEIPYPVQPNLEYGYADIAGPQGAFGTIDYRQTPPSLFLGREITLKEMGISADADEFDAEKRQIKIVKMACPHCNGPLELRAPDASLRVTCPNCNSLLDVDKGNLAYLRTLKQERQQRYPNGAEVVFDRVRMTLVGFMVRGCNVEGTWYEWEEYLLYAPAVGFRWIVNGEGGWYFVDPVSPGEVKKTGTMVWYQGKRFYHKESVAAVVRYVRGEFYWRVEIGEKTRATDFTSRSEMLSEELSSNEVNWSFGRAIDPAALDRAFDPRTGRSNPMVLPAPRVVTPPKPMTPLWLGCGLWVVMIALAIAVWMGLAALSMPRVVLTQPVKFDAETTAERPPPPPAPTDPDSEIRWSPSSIEQTAVVGSFELTGRKNLEIRTESEKPSYSQCWLKLVNDDTGEVRMEQVQTSNRTWTGIYGNPGRGNYTLYAVHLWIEGEQGMSMTVTVRESVADYSIVFLYAIVMLIGPAFLLIGKAIRAITSE